MIEVYHISEPKHIESVIANGLKTLQIQADERLIDLHCEHIEFLETLLLELLNTGDIKRG